MNILSIETSCDETAVSIVKAEGEFPSATYTVLGNSLFSQIDIHREYGGVFPAVAKREHAKTLVPMLKKSLEEAGLLRAEKTSLTSEVAANLHTILYREPTLGDTFMEFLEAYGHPPIDLIAVTSGPGLEPALWVGINFARALSTAWNVPMVPVNHMEGHILSSLFMDDHIPDIEFPALALLISGGHTELDLMQSWGSYACVGETRDDAVGEAFDKVARMLGLPYPGGPEIGKRAEEGRGKSLPQFAALPRPMLDAPNLDFSFSGLKTAVRYAIADKVNAESREGGLGHKTLSEDDISALARDFEDVVIEVLLKKSLRAIEVHRALTFIIGGGVSANTRLRDIFTAHFTEHLPHVALYLPPRHLSTDNSVMIALAGHARSARAGYVNDFHLLKADGNLSLSDMS